MRKFEFRFTGWDDKLNQPINGKVDMLAKAESNVEFLIDSFLIFNRRLMIDPNSVVVNEVITHI